MLLVSLACVAVSTLLGWLLLRRLPKEQDGLDKLVSIVALGVLVLCGMVGLGCSGIWLKAIFS
jgi:hypothetical protein